MSARNRVVVTGLGVVAPNGIGQDAFWDTLIRGQSAIRPITLFDASAHTSRIAGEVQGFDPRTHIGPDTSTRKLARQTQFALAASLQALVHASLGENDLLSGRAFPLVLGVGCAAMDIIEDGMSRFLRLGPGRVPTHTVHGGQPHHAASVVAKHVPLVTQSTTISSACAAGLDAIGTAYELVRRGKVDVALCGGTDAPINPMTFACLAQTGLLSLRNDAPEKASRPFDRDRDSGVISEGAGMIVIENMEHAMARGIVPQMEITGYSSHVDTDPEVVGSGLELSMREALANAGRRPSDVEYVSAHGPGHPVVDRVETAMIKKVFSAHAYAIPVSSIKGVIGNPLAAAGALQVVAAALMMRDNLIPPTANLESPDPECDLDYVPLKARRARIACALINSHGLGGGNSSLVVERVPG